jgi:hypothetical protein
LKWIIGEHFLKGKTAIRVDEDDDIQKIKKNILINMDVVDVVSTDEELKKEWFDES